ncbi:MAG: sugar nucleotide-binding protein [Woeseiaceae bacterium]
MQILLTGGSGLLGTEILKLGTKMLAPSRRELDIRDASAVAAYIADVVPGIILHAAAATNNRNIEADPTAALDVNINGTANIARACLGSKIRLVYVSTDYVYKGDRGNYAETDELLPSNIYAWTKLAGEAAVRAVPDHLIIRTSFGASRFDYPQAFTDKWSSKDYVDRIAPKILKATTGTVRGVLNIGGPRRTIYDYAVERNPDVSKATLSDASLDSPVDTSLNLDKWESLDD